MAKQNNKPLIKNHESRSTDSAPFPEVNVTTYNSYNYGQTRGRGFDNSHSHGSGRRHGRRNNRVYYRGSHSQNSSPHLKLKNKEEKNEKEKSGQTSKHVDNPCYC